MSENDTADIRRQLRAAEIRQLYSQTGAGLIASILGALLVVVVLHVVVRHEHLYTWLGIFLLLQIPRPILMIRFRSVAPQGDAILPWGTWYAIATIASALVWGSAGIVLFPADSILHAVILTIFMAGISAAAAVVFSPALDCSVPVILLLLLPLAGRCLYEGGEVHGVLGVLIALYAAIPIIAARNMHRTNRSSLRRRIANSLLVESLTEEKTRAERNEEVLQAEILEISTSQKDLQAGRTELERQVDLRTAELLEINSRLEEEIAERKKMEEALRESEERYRMLAHHSLTGIYIHQGNSIVYANERLAGFMGYSPEEMIGRKFSEFVHPLDRESVRRRGMAGSFGMSAAPHYEFRLRCKDGEPKWVEVLATTIPYRGSTANMGNIADISERKRVEASLQKARSQLEERVRERTAELKEINEKLRLEIADRKRAENELSENEKKFRSLFESSTEFIHILDTNGNIMQTNPETVRRLGYSEEELVGKPVADILTPKSRTMYTRQLPFLTRHGASRAELEMVCKNGDLITVDSSASAIRDENGTVTCYVEFQREITEQKRARQAVELAAKELHRALVASASLRADAEAANRAKSEFLANMSHELRTPLNAIIGFSEILVDQVFGRLNDRQSDYIGYILNSGRHLLELINDVLDLAKVESGRMELQAAMTNLRGLVEDSLVMIKERSLKHNLSLSVEVPEELEDVEALADELRLKQIMFNLLSNAVKFTADGGKIHVKVDRQGADFRISVSDTGVGVAADDLERIFSSFEQVESSYGRRRQGTGLGLALTRRLVELHGGRIWAESEGAGKGSTFTFTIPAEGVGETAVSHAPANAQPSTAGGRRSEWDGLRNFSPSWGLDEPDGISSRSAILDVLQRELSRADREDRPLGVLILEVHGAESVTGPDTRMVWNALVREVGRKIGASSRPYDSLGKYDKNRFIMVLPGCDRVDGRRIAERMHLMFRDAPVVSSYGVFDVNLVVGVGVAEKGGDWKLESIVLKAVEDLRRHQLSERDPGDSAGNVRTY